MSTTRLRVPLRSGTRGHRDVRRAGRGAAAADGAAVPWPTVALGVAVLAVLLSVAWGLRRRR